MGVGQAPPYSYATDPECIALFTRVLDFVVVGVHRLHSSLLTN